MRRRKQGIVIMGIYKVPALLPFLGSTGIQKSNGRVVQAEADD